MSKKIKCALIGPGNIGTDLLAKLQRSHVLEPVWMVGIDPESDGLKRAREMGIKNNAQALTRGFDEITMCVGDEARFGDGRLSIGGGRGPRLCGIRGNIQRLTARHKRLIAL